MIGGEGKDIGYLKAYNAVFNLTERLEPLNGDSGEVYIEVEKPKNPSGLSYQEWSPTMLQNYLRADGIDFSDIKDEVEDAPRYNENEEPLEIASPEEYSEKVRASIGWTGDGYRVGLDRTFLYFKKSNIIPPAWDIVEDSLGPLTGSHENINGQEAY